jgi:hypothetical protein
MQLGCRREGYEKLSCCIQIRVLNYPTDANGLTKEVPKTETKMIKLVSKAEPVVYEYFPVRGGKYTFEFITVDEHSKYIPHNLNNLKARLTDL